MFVVKNKDGRVILFYKRPKLHKNGYWLSQDGKYFYINERIFPNLKVGDEPLKVKLVQIM